ncbi:ribosomal protein L10-domain-containing protein [Syncephalis pseudoplumigaleata]|uniref:Ribosome assembly factor mrt4 n=1 Tax=Syncephalis pseudoplumigaleata TaxID=1712513 RepID=A0A4P9Z3Q3_9FUNG|nr:ribosomal protein L10-domain-containing protein [Syncephalis pseudoplumigaleata]|eukprot:RKP27183.1 ribosomal protein L10-domain-containing protein [Syncephalis pseudoplumigaleata]
MPKSKRQKIFSLTQTTRKGREEKESLIEKVRECADKYSTVFVFSVATVRNQNMKEIRKTLADSRFLFGSNKVLIKALGDSPESAYKENFEKISSRLVGEVGLLFTNESLEDVTTYLKDFSRPDYARSGNKAEQTVTVPAGVLMRGDDPFPGNMDVQLRALGMPLKRDGGKLVIDQPYTICKEGDTLTPNQAHLLKLFWQQTAEFRVNPLGYWKDNEMHSL